MSWDEELFLRFVEATVEMARGQMPGYGYPHVIFPYPPQQEMMCIARVRALPGLLSSKGIQAMVLPVAPEMAKATARWANRALPRLLDYQRLEGDLSHPRDGVVAKVAERLAAKIKMTPRDTVFVLGRLGTLYPFGHVSALLDGLVRNGVEHTLSVAYPGTAHGTELRLLGKVDPTGGYRGHVVT